jgi:hypothetical protein
MTTLNGGDPGIVFAVADAVANKTATQRTPNTDAWRTNADSFRSAQPAR